MIVLNKFEICQIFSQGYRATFLEYQLSEVGLKGKVMGSNIKIYIACHKKCFLPKNKFVYPIQVGTALSDEHFKGMLHDDIGSNISDKNLMYSELTAQYWAWKNDDADYYGFFHYRRYMSFAKQSLVHNPFQDVVLDYLDEAALETINFNENAIYDTVSKYDIIATTPVNIKDLHYKLKSNREQYESTKYLYKKDLELLLEIIKEKYPDYFNTAIEYLNSDKGYFCNIFIMKKELFHNYSKWLFSILSEHEYRSNSYENYDIDAYRISGHLGERLFGIYYLYIQKQKTYKCCELQRTLFLNTEALQPLQPAFVKNNIVIALAANDLFIPYTGVTLSSIIANSSDDNNYDILLLTEDISKTNKQLLADMIDEQSNFKVRFLNPGKLLGNYQLYTREHFSLETYYRLVLPELASNYDKVLYLDSDLILNIDISELFFLDIKDYLIAACLDADTSGLYNGYEPQKKAYTDNVLRLQSPYLYFQAGVLLINLKKFRETYASEYMVKYASSNRFELLDQDVLNVLCEGKVKFVDMSWNVMVDYNEKRINEIIRRAPQWQFRQYMEARKHPKIVHYAGPQKPWYSPEMDFGTLFWKYAKTTPFYEIILSRMVSNNKNNSEPNLYIKLGKKISGEGRLLPYGSRRREYVKAVVKKFTKS